MILAVAELLGVVVEEGVGLHLVEGEVVELMRMDAQEEAVDVQ